MASSKRINRNMDRRQQRRALNGNISFFRQGGKRLMRVRYGDGIHGSDLRGNR